MVAEKSTDRGKHRLVDKVPSPLPIDGELPRIKTALQTHNALILIAPPGSGKSTRVPPCLLNECSGKILLLQPRRAAARLLAHRIAEEIDAEIGSLVGYQIRFERRTSTQTRIEVLTEGVLLRRLQRDPFLEGTDVVILDEFHERSANTDLLLALLRELQLDIRPDLKIIICSATLNPKPLQEYFEQQVALILAQGRHFPVQISYLEKPTRKWLEHGCQKARSFVEAQTSSTVLFFLPGVRSIHKALKILDGCDVEILPLHGKLSTKEQQKALSKAPHSRIILSTNIAETSLTVPNLKLVVDSGLHRCAYSYSGFTELKTERISLDSADQRAGRAGRTAQGQVFRLWTEVDNRLFEPQRTPELQRIELSSILLQIYGWGSRPERIHWLSSPNPTRVNSAQKQLNFLGAINSHGITTLGEKMLSLPLSPNLAKLLIEAKEQNCASEAIAFATLMTEGAHHQNDELEKSIERLLQKKAPHHQLQTLNQLARLLQIKPKRSGNIISLLKCLIKAYPHRVGKKLNPRRGILADGKTIQIHSSVVLGADFFIALQIHMLEHGERIMKQAHSIDLSWLKLTENTQTYFKHERVESVRQKCFLNLVAEQYNCPIDPEQASKELLKQALLHFQFSPDDKAQQLFYRLLFIERTVNIKSPISSWEDLLADLCVGKKSFEELRKINLHQKLSEKLSWEHHKALADHAPARFKLPTGSSTPVRYFPDAPPVIAARIQQLFGLTRTPKIGGIPCLVQLLAPNNRPQQSTRDLSSFWNNTYSMLRKELRGRYPKHAWPEHPTLEDAQDRPVRKKR